ncbi:hypothetical protein NBRC116188_14980 [Oceaniserpentilla sp. 4NH20-0058]
MLEPGTNYNFVNEVEYILDDTHKLTIEDIRKRKNWTPITSVNINFSLITDTLWLNLKVKAKQDGDWYLKTPYPLLDYYSNFSFINNQPLDPIHTGDKLPFNSRLIRHPYYVFPYKLKENDLLDIYLKVNTKGAAEVPLHFLEKKSYKLEERLRTFLLGWMNGILVVMMLYNFSIYFFIKQKIYLTYVFNVGFYIMGTAMYNGTAFQHLWPNKPDLNEYLYPTFLACYHFFNILFIVMILNTNNRNKFIKYYFMVILIATFSLIPLSFILPYEIIIPIEVIIALILNFSAFLLGAFYSIKGERIAQFFTIAWGLYILGLLIANLRVLGILQANWFTLYVYQIGAFIQVSVLSIALAQRIEKQRQQSINTLNKYKNLYNTSLSGQFTLNKRGVIIDANPAFTKMLDYDNTEEILNRSKENHREYFHENESTPKSIFKNMYEKGYIIDLEVQLKNKNGELIWFSVSVKSVRNNKGDIISYQGSAINIQERKQNEENKKRAMRERMLAMEHLVVGICHEINTPLGVSKTAISQLKDDFKFLTDSFENNELTKSIFSQRLEFEYEAIEIINNNLEKINQLISEFKEVSVLQKGYKYQESSINIILEEIELVLSKMIGKENVIIICEENIPFKGYPRAITDMLTNLYTNSVIHGFEEQEGVIKILASTDKDSITIKVKDNGIGIDSRRIRDIFNPFYTSKRGNKGSIGLGLFQVFNIVTQILDGNIEVENTHPGVEFTITFPVSITRVEDRGGQKEEHNLKLIN